MFKVREIVGATDGRLIKGSLDKRVARVSIDSRNIKPGDVFIAIRGKDFNGHDFINRAVKKGASCVVFCHSHFRLHPQTLRYSKDTSLIEVKDTVRALGRLAHYYRKKFKIPVIAITGSNGKTTTKEMLNAVLSSRFNVLRNPGTRNNYIGVPLAILNLRKKHRMAVIEIGANHFGEIEWLSWIVQPSIGIITNIGPSHLEFFKSLKGVFRAKLELIKNLTKDGKIVINRDDNFLSQLNGKNLSTITYGVNRISDFNAEIIEETWKGTVFLLNRRHQINLNVLGRHNVYNALAACACARQLGIAYRQIKRVFSSFKPPSMRMQMIRFKNMSIINDCYNANPESFKYALEFLKGQSGSGKKIVVCGDMLELGRQAEKFHINLGRKIAEEKIDFLVTLGNLAKMIAYGARLSGMPEKSIFNSRNFSDAAKFLSRMTQAQDVILIKGSRAIKMENIIKCFTTSSIR